MTDRLIPLEGVRNFRDFGGYTSSYGGEVRRGLLYRSGHYAEASAGDIDALTTRDIKIQVDLRRPDERARMVAKWNAPTLIINDGGAETEAPHQRFLKRVEANAEKSDEWMMEYYQKAPFKAHHVAMFSEWFERLAGLGASEAGLVNCAAGKDRTGILCALTHHVLGVSQDDIFADYDLTNTAVDIEENLPEATKYFNDMLDKSYDKEVYRPFMGVHVRYLERALSVIAGEAGSIDAYLTDVLKVDQAKQDALRGRLLNT
jgi:protein tyrosine/serine phosphatase